MCFVRGEFYSSLKKETEFEQETQEGDTPMCCNLQPATEKRSDGRPLKNHEERCGGSKGHQIFMTIVNLVN